jgi:hypothetical protein
MLLLVSLCGEALCFARGSEEDDKVVAPDDGGASPVKTSAEFFEALLMWSGGRKAGSPWA